MKKGGGIRGVIFDWDGTLLDSYHADAAAFLAMFHELGIPWTERELHKHYSPNWHRVYRAAGIPESRWEEADRIWHRHYRKHRPKLLPGAKECLRTLERKYRLALVTSGNRKRVRRQLREFGLTNVFAARVFAEDAAHRKPHPAPLQMALRALRLKAEDCVYVGDAPEDVEMARRAGTRAIGFLGPFPTHKRLRQEKPDGMTGELGKIGALVERLGRNGRGKRVSRRNLARD